MKKSSPPPGALVNPEAAAHHIRLLGKDPLSVRIRAFVHKGHPLKALPPEQGGIQARKRIGINVADLNLWQREGRNIYLVINDGGNTKASITACRAFWAEWDDRPLAWQLTAWQELGLPEPTFILVTGGKSAHLYWVLSELITVEQWHPLQVALVAHAKADPINDPSRVLRLAGCSYIGPDGKPHGMAEIVHESGRTYTAEQIAAALPQQPLTTETAAPAAASDHHPIVLDDPIAPDLPPRTLAEVREALAFIPTRFSGSYSFHRNVLWGLIDAVKEAGGSIEDAINLMELHCPSNSNGWNISQVAHSGNGSVKAGTFWIACSQHGFNLKATRTQPRQQQPGPAATDDRKPSTTVKPPAQEIAEIFEALLDLQTSPGDTWAKQHALRADLWRLGVPASAIDERIYYALAKRWGLPLQTSHDGGRRGRSLSDPVDSQAEDLIPGFLLWQRDHLLFGAGGSGKTLAAAAMAVSCIKGVPFLDQQIPPSRTGRVLWIGTDGGEGARAMVREYLEDLGFADDVDVVSAINIWTAEATQSIPSWSATPLGLQELRDELETGGYVLVVIDSLKAVLELAGVNFSIGPVGTLMRLLQALVGRHCSLLWLHHPAGGKAAGKGLTAAAGSQNINQIPSAVHQITRNTTDRGVCNTWSVHKLRGAQSREFTYRLSEDGFEMVEGQITQNARQKLLDSIELRMAQDIPTSTVYLMQELPTFNESTIRNNLTWLRKRGLIRKNRRSWELTPQGATYLRLSMGGVDLDHWLRSAKP